MKTGGWRAVLLTSALTLAAGCAAPSAGPPIARQLESHPVVTISAPPTPARPAPVPLGEGRSVRQPWEDASLTAQFCGVSGAVRFKDRAARARSTLYSEVALYMGTPVYGRLDTLGEVAGISVACNNTGGTAAGDLGGAYVIVVARDGQLLSVAELVPQADVGDRPSFIRGVSFRGNTVVAHEAWYRSEDANCCPSGRAETPWHYDDGTFSPGWPHVS
jgi:hypothetical protein